MKSDINSWTKYFAGETSEMLERNLQNASKNGYASLNYMTALLNEIEKRKYAKVATQGIDPELGFSELLDVL